MVVVEVWLNSLDLSSDIADMRSWLDGNGVDTLAFSYREQVDRLLGRVTFRTRAGAEAFAVHFAGRVVSDISLGQAAPATPRG